MKKTKHNKKRNTGFIYETLIRELTKAIISENTQKKTVVLSIIREYFKSNTLLSKELELYRALSGLNQLEPILAEKVIIEAKQQHAMLNKKKLFVEQSHIINKINKILSKSVFSNFIPDYKNLATIAQIFSNDTPLKTRVLLEQSLIEDGRALKESKKMKPIDDLVYKTFVNKFNNKYTDDLLKEQKELLGKYISSFSDNGLGLKVFLNEEIQRLRQIVTESVDDNEFKNDDYIAESTKEVLNLIETFKTKQIDSKMLQKILEIQHLVSEIQTNG